MCILAVTMQYQAATGKTQPWRNGSVTVEAQSRPTFGLALASWDIGMLLYCKFYHLVANQFDTGPPIALGPFCSGHSVCVGQELSQPCSFCFAPPIPETCYLCYSLLNHV